jgi:small subunit ribosomal protein S5
MSDETVNENTPEEEITAEVVESTEAGAEVETLAGAVDDLDLLADEVVADPGEVRFDKLKKAEEILRSSAPASSRDDFENSFEKVVHINRCAKVVKGGRRFSFSALVVSGDREGKVGFGFGKAQEVAECIKKASESSKKFMVSVNITNNTIPHPVIGEHGGGRVMLLPASPGTGLIAGGGVRAVVEAAGIKDILAKSMGSNNQANVVKATINALEQLRTKEQIYALRGKRLAEKRAL